MGVEIPPGRTRAKVRRALTLVGLLPRVLRQVWASSGRWTVVWLALLLLAGLLPVAVVSLSRLLVDALVAAIRSRGAPDDLSLVVVLGSAVGGVLLGQELVRGASGWVRANQAERLKDHIAALIQRKSAEVDYAFYESPEYFDRLHRARSESKYRPLVLLEQLGALLQNGVSLLALAALLLPYAGWLPAVLLLSTLPAFWVMLHFSQLHYLWRVRATPHERRAEYNDWVLTDRQTAAELRLFGMAGHFIKIYQGVRSFLRREHLRLALRQVVAQLVASTVALAVTAAAMIWMVWRAVHGLHTLGDLVLFYQVFDRGQRGMSGLLGNVGQLYANTLYLTDLFAFLDLPQQVKEPKQPRAMPEPGGRGIAFEGVTFAYPGSDQPVLRDFSLRLPAGQLTAMVGANGAGKSTVVKLICRLYDPQQGRIALNDVDLRQLELAELRRQVAVLFQDPVRYSDTAAANIAVSDLARADHRPAVERAAESTAAAAMIRALPQGYDTLLGKWFEGGSELSGGQWRRLALARAAFGEGSILLLDEPTSGMDSWNEQRWMDRLRRLARGRTALVITHRFATAMRADRILVMWDGEVVESGTHQELLAQKGRYAESWQAQMGDKNFNKSS